jgi:hypothetical protein
MSLEPIPGWPFERAEEVALALEELLAVHGIAINAGSALEGAILSAMQIAERKKRGFTVYNSSDIRPDYRAMAGVHELSCLILAVKDHRSFPQLIPHLRLLNKGAALQNTKSRGNDDATNKLFELLVACLAMSFADDVQLDDPERCAGNNPDVLALIAGRLWGFACKALHSTHPEGFLDHLRKGIDQIERSPAEVGVVVFSLKNVLPHDDLWPLRPDASGTGMLPAAWPTAEHALGAMQYSSAEIGRRLNQAVAGLGAELASEFSGKKSIPAFLLWASSVTGVLLNGQPVPTILRMMTGVTTNGAPKLADQAVLESLNWAAFHDSPLRGPKPALKPEKATGGAV